MIKGVIKVHTDPDLWIEKCFEETKRIEHISSDELICCIGKWIVDHNCGICKESGR